MSDAERACGSGWSRRSWRGAASATRRCSRRCGRCRGSAFVAPGYEAVAYEDGPLPIGEGQTISQPYIVALMVEAAALGPGDRVLEVGAGSGYAAAVVAQIAARVFAIERHESLAREAARRCAALGYGNVEIRVGDGTLGWPEAAPFDAVLVAAGAPEPPRALKQQLEVGGRLVIPVGDGGLGQVAPEADAHRRGRLGPAGPRRACASCR